MPVAQTDTAFRTRSSAQGGALNTPTHTPRPAPQTRSGASQRLQSRWLILMVLAACFCGSIGLLYLSSYARLTREGYRRDTLLRQLRSEQEKSRQLEQIRAIICSPGTIEAKARERRMILADDSQAVTVRGEF